MIDGAALKNGDWPAIERATTDALSALDRA
jgi:hypothetical protein